MQPVPHLHQEHHLSCAPTVGILGFPKIHNASDHLYPLMFDDNKTLMLIATFQRLFRLLHHGPWTIIQGIISFQYMSLLFSY